MQEMEKYVLFGAAVFAVAMIILFFSVRKTKKDEAPAKKVGEETRKLLPEQAYDTFHHCYVMKEGNYMDLMQVRSKDLNNASIDEKEYDSLKFCKMYRIYERDLKLIVMNFPCDTKIQQEYLKRRISKTTNPVYKKYLESQVQELVGLEKNTTTREFYLMLFAASIEELEECRRAMKTTLHTGKDGLVMEIPDEKKHQILYRMNNKCSQVA